MPQLPLRLVSAPSPGRAAPGRAAGPPASPPNSARSADIERLRALLGSRGRIGIVPPPPSPLAHNLTPGLPLLAPGHVSTGILGLDAWLHGWPQPGPVELVGLAGSGRLALVVPLIERLTRQGRSVLLVDPLHQVHPPGLGRADMSRLVMVRPPGERAAWAAEQVARSGAVDMLLVLDAPPLGRGGVRLARAAEAGGMAVFVLSERPEAELPAALRLEAAGWQSQGDQLRVRCMRSRDGRMVGERLIVLSEPAERSAVYARPSSGRVEAARLRRVGTG